MITPRSRLLAFVGAALIALGAGACGSSGGAASATTAAATTTTPPTTVAATTTTAGAPASGTAGAISAQADALCSQIDTALGDLSHLDLKNPTNEAALATDFAALNSDASAISAAGAASKVKPQVTPVVGAVQAAIAAGEAAAGQVAKGNLTAGAAGIATMVKDLGTAKAKAAAANLGNCAAGGSSGSSATSAG